MFLGSKKGFLRFSRFARNDKKGIMTQSLKRESSNYTQLWIPDQVGNDKTAKTPTFCESINIKSIENKIHLSDV